MSNKSQKEIFSANLNMLLANHKLTQRQFAEAIGEKQQTINSWCTGNALPRMGRIQKIADFFQINKSDLLEEMSDTKLASIEERHLLEKIRKLNDEGKRQIETQLDNLLRIDDYLESPEKETNIEPEPLLAAAHGSENMTKEELAEMLRDLKNRIDNGEFD